MGVVTNLIITFSVGDLESNIVKEINRYAKYEPGFSIASVKDKNLPEHWYGGSKYLECNVLIGAYNGLNFDQFLTFLKTEVEWEDPDLVQLFVKFQEDMLFSIVTLV